MNLMPVQNNKLVAQIWMEFINKNDIEGLFAITADTWKMHGGLADLPAGSAGIRQLFASFGQIKQQWIIQDIIAENDKVVVRAINRCEQESFLGLSGIGHEQIFSATFIHHIVDGRIQETWRNADDLGRLLQLGAKIVAPVEGKSIPTVPLGRKSEVSESC